ncbi:MAG: DUF1853 family protein [Bdellovibrionales bacterium]|nr:DUF1853 family protein [Bdellovibrionales bacterium]
MRAVEELLWALLSPSLLEDSLLPVVSDQECQSWFSTLQLSSLRPELLEKSLVEFLSSKRRTGRLGNAFEDLLEFGLTHLLHVERFSRGVAIREGRETIGELDFLFAWPGFQVASFEHWEAAVKFYMCIAPAPEMATDARFFVGQALLDRLDLKLDLTFQRQLLLPHDPRALETLKQRGYDGPIRSRAFFKGRLFYPLAWQGKDIPIPRSVSNRHERGWWLAWDRDQALESLRTQVVKYSEFGWLLIPKSHWLLPRARQELSSDLILSDEGLSSSLEQHFSESDNALQIACMRREADGGWVECAGPEALGRGMVLKPGWPNSQSDMSSA